MTNMRNPHLTFITTALKAIGAELPKPLSKAIEETTRIREHVASVRNRAQGYPALAAAWADAVLDGRDPAEDREVFRALLNSQLLDGDIEYAASNVISDRAIAALKDVRDDILTTFKTAFDEAGQTLTRAHSILGDTSLDNTTTIFQLGPVAVQAHQDAQEARRIVRIIDNGWGGLNSLTNFAGSQIEVATRWTDSGIDTWEKIRHSKDAWDMTTKGATLDLAIDHGTITARHERLAAERAQRDGAPDMENRDLRRKRGAAVVAAVEAARAVMAG